MAFTTGFTVQQLADLEATIALGVGSTGHNGKITTFQDLAKMMVLRDRMRAELAQAAAAAASPRPQAPFMTRATIFYRG